MADSAAISISGDRQGSSSVPLWATSSADFLPLSAVIEEIMRRRESRKVALFTGILLAYAVIQAAYAMSIDSLGLLSDALHMFFHVGALSVSLLGMVYARRPATFAFSYGYARFEVLAAFSNALFLIFVVLFVMAGGLARLVQPQAFETDSVLTLEFGLIGLIINVAGMAMLGPGSSTFDHLNRFAAPGSLSASKGGLGKDAVLGAANREAIYLNFLSDGVSSLAVIVSSLLVRYRGFALADTLQCFATGVFTLWLVIPLFTATGKILLQTVPQGLDAYLSKCRRQLTIIEGVVELAQENYWLQTPGHAVGSLVLRVRHDVDASEVMGKAQRILNNSNSSGGVLQDLTIQVEKEPSPLTSSSSLASAPISISAGAGEDHHGHSHSHSHSHGHSHGGAPCSGHH